MKFIINNYKLICGSKRKRRIATSGGNGGNQ